MQRQLIKEESPAEGKLNSKPHQAEHYDMVVFCHLRWDFVWQRPQHIISRMAQHYKILFVEEPLNEPSNQSTTFLKIIHKNLHVLQLRATHIAEMSSQLLEFIDNKKIHIGWLYSAAFSPLLSYFHFDLIIYDCMDELSLFKNAACELLAQEKELLSKADIVFTGGKSIYENKSQLHANVHLFPSSVEQTHFAKAYDPDLAIPSDIACYESPIVGYTGVIDERIDLELIAKVAALNPHVTFIMIGPVAKIGEEELPKLPNIHYLGFKSYKELPNYLKAFDVAMMPFALNDATRYISPTKTLEYMAAGKPIISTAIKDVVRDYQSCVYIIGSAEEFSKALKNITEKPDQSQADQFRNILAKTSWDNTVQQMKFLMKDGNDL